jgi:hypothetical protein
MSTRTIDHPGEFSVVSSRGLDDLLPFRERASIEEVDDVVCFLLKDGSRALVDGFIVQMAQGRGIDIFRLLHSLGYALDPLPGVFFGLRRIDDKPWVSRSY